MSEYVKTVSTPLTYLCDVCRFGALPIRRAVERGKGEIWLCPEHSSSLEDYLRLLHRRAARAHTERSHGP